MKKFIKDKLYYTGTATNSVLCFKYTSQRTGGARFTPIAPINRIPFYSGVEGLVKICKVEAERYRRAFHWSDLPTTKDRENASLKADTLNGKFEDEILRHYAAKRARLRNLTPVLGGEYYAKP